ncbi:hypothetical protein LOTGIDRAFT_229246 [Lottia gigantea]|uniref:Fibrinogen C-terminal domain-containing protein n=1 Tax=Lottia gigantea TaxID=225164 RepID=V3Z870_LOTGI|nr:hypothetical protein LOTGIDRAFT_229246 [Lottia gigantea]ESO87053.1 hypothetical protein LOTGIDRAFT_229246 [Lottia gigantea]
MFDRKTKICLMFESGENCFHHENIGDKVCYRLKSLCNNVNCPRCPIGYYGDACQQIIQDCSDGHHRNVARKASLISYIQPTSKGEIIEAKCNFDYGGITLFQLRESLCDPVDFNRNWIDYVNGFGYIHGEYWLGLKHVYNILQNYPAIALQVNFQYGYRGWQGYFNYFSLSDHDTGYKFSAGSYYGAPVDPIGNSLTVAPNSLEGRPFSTYDNDISGNDCPNRFKGGFWFMNKANCSRANPNGRRNHTNFESSLFWLDDLGDRNDFTKVQLRLNRI